MPPVNDGLRKDINRSLDDCLAWTRLARLSADIMCEGAETAQSAIDFNAMAKVISLADNALQDLAVQLGEFFQADIPLDPGMAATALAFYADERSYRAPRGQASPVARDGGLIARTALTTLTDEDGGNAE